MKSLEERVSELEQKVADLEGIIKNREKEIPKFIPVEAKKVNVPIKPEIVRPIPQIAGNFKPEEKPKKEDREAFIGKYFIGVLAALLIFIGAASFVGLIWYRMTPEIKLAVLALSGIGLSALGFWLIRTKKNPITSIILGTGAGLVFISILSANLAFHMIGSYMTVLFATIWAVIFVLSSKYTNLFFTTVIAHIGSYITLIFGLIHMERNTDLGVLILFVTVVSASMLYVSYSKKKAEKITVILLSYFSYFTVFIASLTGHLTIFLHGSFYQEFIPKELIQNYMMQFLVVVILYVLMNVFYRMLREEIVVPVYLAVDIINSIVTCIFIVFLTKYHLKLSTAAALILFFVVQFIQFVISRVLYKNKEQWITGYYAAMLVIISLFLNVEINRSVAGIVIVGILLAGLDKILKDRNHSFLIGGIAVLDVLFTLWDGRYPWVTIIYSLIQLGLFGYVLWNNIRLKEYKYLNILKIMGLFVFLIKGFLLPPAIIDLFHSKWEGIYSLEVTMGYIVAVFGFIALLYIGYFRDWQEEGFKFKGSKLNISKNGKMQIVVFSVSIFLYVIGLARIGDISQPFLQIIFVLPVLAITLLQSAIIFSDKKEDSILGLWTVVKYLVLMWRLLAVFSDLSFASPIYSVVGLVVAIVCISVGFRVRYKGIRMYGLVLTILMVAKFILVDLYRENSLTRVAALVVGGILCFAVSVIYNKLSENYSEKG